MSTFCQGMKNHLTRKVGFEGTPKLGPVLEVTTSYLQGKYGVEIRIESINKDDSHSWVRISHGLNKSKTTKTYSCQPTNQRLKQNHRDVLLPAHPQELNPSGKESGLISAHRLPSVKKTEYSSSSW